MAGRSKKPKIIKFPRPKNQLEEERDAMESAIADVFSSLGIDEVVFGEGEDAPRIDCRRKRSRPKIT